MEGYEEGGEEEEELPVSVGGGGKGGGLARVIGEVDLFVIMGCGSLDDWNGDKILFVWENCNWIVETYGCCFLHLQNLNGLPPSHIPALLLPLPVPLGAHKPFSPTPSPFNSPPPEPSPLHPPLLSNATFSSTTCTPTITSACTNKLKSYLAPGQ